MDRQQQADLFISILERSHLPLVVTRVDDGRVLYANSAYADFRGFDAADALIGRSGIEIGAWVNGAEREGWREQLRQDGRVIERISHDNSLGQAMFFSEYLQFDDADLIVTFCVDVSSVTRVEQELQSALSRLSRAQRIAKIGDFTFDAQRQLLTGSQQLSEMLQVDFHRGIAIPTLLRDFIDDEDVDQVRTVLNSQPRFYNFTTRFNRPDGQQLWIEVFGSASYNEDDSAALWEGTIQDVTERKQSQLEQERLDEEMRSAQKLESLGLLAGGVAHDFNNLLVAIMGNADLALLEDDLTDAVRERLQDVVTASQRAADLTAQLLAYSGKGKFQKQLTDLSHLVEEMSELLRVTISRRCHLQLFLNERIATVDIDQTQIRQVLMNLIINASEAIEHSDGVITVSTNQVYCDKAQIAGIKAGEEMLPGDYVVIEVSDNGSGMPEEVVNRLFEPFFTTKVTGRGLGMSAVLGIVRGHGGGVALDSEVGKGTRFSLYLPVSQQDVLAPEAPPLPTKDAQGGTRSVLVIDDDPLVIGVLQQALDGMGFAVFIAESGPAGLELYQRLQAQIDLVMVDLTMPGMDGIETFERLRQINPYAQTILMSGYNEQVAVEKLTERGLTGFLHKPFLLEDLRQAIGRALDES